MEIYQLSVRLAGAQRTAGLAERNSAQLVAQCRRQERCGNAHRQRNGSLHRRKATNARSECRYCPRTEHAIFGFSLRAQNYRLEAKLSAILA